MQTLEHPASLLLLVPLAFLLYLRYFRANRGGTLWFSYRSWPAGGSRSGPTLRGVLWVASEAIFWAALFLLVVAAAGPSSVERERVYLSSGAEIVFVLDQSPSMAAEDFRPTNRFEAAKGMIRSFAAGRPNDRLGLVGFATQTVLHVPPTVDREAFLSALESLRVMELGEDTAIGTGLAVAALHLCTHAGARRAIVLLTDGENNAGEMRPETAAEIARRLGIRIYTVGIGREGETTVRFVDPRTGSETVGTYRGRFDEELLERIAYSTGGQYYYAGNPASLKLVFQEIDSSESAEARFRIHASSRPRFAPFVLSALLLLGVHLLLRRSVLRGLY